MLTPSSSEHQSAFIAVLAECQACRRDCSPSTSRTRPGPAAGPAPQRVPDHPGRVALPDP
jgi:hypothetical protein